tara:strand:- start:1689 stop:2558 length:870 start_codon:yes stop_codon:yes gene_type:complete
VTNQLIQWYPGHIAKAEKQLKNNLSKVDLILEVRDARIPMATSHPHLEKWLKGKKHLLIMNRQDMILDQSLKQWDKWFKEQGQTAWWCDAQAGTGIRQIKEAAIRTGSELNQRRTNRGMRVRAVRALTLGFPNVGKSALINRLVKKKVVASARRAGVTKSLRWVRIDQGLDLLDAPGVLPPRIDDQRSALKLAICDDIGEASYEMEFVAIHFLKMLEKIKRKDESGIDENLLERRYGVPLSGVFLNNEEKWLLTVAERHTSGDTRRMAQRILDDFRKNLLGRFPLEFPE